VAAFPAEQSKRSTSAAIAFAALRLLALQLRASLA
jgi:hypothetical protein